MSAPSTCLPKSKVVSALTEKSQLLFWGFADVQMRSQGSTAPGRTGSPLPARGQRAPRCCCGGLVSPLQPSARLSLGGRGSRSAHKTPPSPARGVLGDRSICGPGSSAPRLSPAGWLEVWTGQTGQGPTEVLPGEAVPHGVGRLSATPRGFPGPLTSQAAHDTTRVR